MLTYTTELCNEHRQDVAKFFNVSGTFPTDTAQKWGLYDTTSKANISTVAVRHINRWFILWKRHSIIKLSKVSVSSTTNALQKW